MSSFNTNLFFFNRVEATLYMLFCLTLNSEQRSLIPNKNILKYG